LQARVSARSALQQVHLAHQKQLEMMQSQTAYQATSHTMKAIWAVYIAGNQAISNHGACEDYSERDTNNLREATSELEDCDNLYVAHLPSVIQGPVSDLLDKCSYSPAGWRDLRKRRSGDEFACCGYISTLEEVTEMCLRLTTWFRQARVEILNGNKEASILNEDPFIWLLNFAPPVNYEEAVKWRMEEIERDENNRLRIARARNKLRMQGGSLSLEQYASADPATLEAFEADR
jgi:hypothetical protein